MEKGRLAGAAGFEPATLGFGDRCSTSLSYAPANRRGVDRMPVTWRPLTGSRHSTLVTSRPNSVAFIIVQCTAQPCTTFENGMKLYQPGLHSPAPHFDLAVMPLTHSLLRLARRVRVFHSMDEVCREVAIGKFPDDSRWAHPCPCQRPAGSVLRAFSNLVAESSSRFLDSASFSLAISAPTRSTTSGNRSVVTSP